MLICLLKGILIGLIFGIPAGAVGALCVSRSLEYGVKSGIVTGLGSSAADCLYAIVGAFGITIVSDFLTKYQTYINIAGGLLILVMGIMTIMKKSSVQGNASENRTGYPAMFLSAFGIGITNPAAVITFLFAFSYFGIANDLSALEGTMLVAGVLIGTLVWWIAISNIAGIIRQKHGDKGFAAMNKVFGAIMTVFALIVFIRAAVGGGAQ